MAGKTVQLHYYFFKNRKKSPTLWPTTVLCSVLISASRFALKLFSCSHNLVCRGVGNQAVSLQELLENQNNILRVV